MAIAPRFWDGIAEEYAAKPVEDREAFERKIARTEALLDAGSVFVDVGCGTGSLALILARTARESHGLDFSPEMVRIAREKAAADGIENARFHVGEIGDAPFEPGTIDVLGAFSLLHLLEDRPAFLRRAIELLKPGGTLVSSTVCLGGSWVPYRLMIGAMRLVGKAPYVDIVSTDRVLEDLEQAGFVDVETVDVGARDSNILFTLARRPSRDTP